MGRTRNAMRDARCASDRRQPPWRLGVPMLVLALFAAACGTDTGSVATSAQADPAAFPVTVRGSVIPALPQRIVSLSATHTEVLYQIGSGPEIIATDVFSDYPPQAATTQKVDAFNLSVEAVAELDPDLVVLSFDPGDAVAGFEALGIPVLLFAPPGPVTLDEVYAEWIDLGTATGHADEAAALATQTQRDIEAALEVFPPPPDRPTYFIELDSTLFTAGRGTLIDHIFSLVGLQSVADPSDGPFPQFSAEALVAADPYFYFLADTMCCGESAASVGARPGFDLLSAVQADRVVELDDSLVSRWGDRLDELVLIVATEVANRR